MHIWLKSAKEASVLWSTDTIADSQSIIPILYMTRSFFGSSDKKRRVSTWSTARSPTRTFALLGKCQVASRLCWCRAQVWLDVRLIDSQLGNNSFRVCLHFVGRKLFDAPNSRHHRNIQSKLGTPLSFGFGVLCLLCSPLASPR